MANFILLLFLLTPTGSIATAQVEAAPAETASESDVFPKLRTRELEIVDNAGRVRSWP